jgi:hypothetical protein
MGRNVTLPVFGTCFACGAAVRPYIEPVNGLISTTIQKLRHEAEVLRDGEYPHNDLAILLEEAAQEIELLNVRLFGKKE